MKNNVGNTERSEGGKKSLFLVTEMWISAYDLGWILPVFSVFKQIYITVLKCILNVVALWNFTEFEITALTWWQRQPCHMVYME